MRVHYQIIFLAALPLFASTASATSDQAWWLQFEDPTLNQLITEGLGDNYDMQAAKGRIQQAEAISRQNLSALLPSVTFDVGLNTTPYEAPQTPVNPMAPLDEDEEEDEDPELIHNSSAMLNARLETDIWGRNYLNHSASRLDVSASRADRDNQAINLARSIASTYYDAVSAQRRLQLLQHQVDTNKDLLGLVEQRYEQGAASALDVLQQRQQVQAATSQLPQGEILYQTTLMQLAVLLGRAPTAPLPELPQQLPTPPPLPRSALQQSLERPDLRAAQARVQAAEKRSSSAVRALLPSLRLNGQAGLQSSYLEELQGDYAWSLGATISVPLFEGGRNYAAIRQAEANAVIAERTHSQLQLQAAQQVAMAKVQEEQHRARLTALQNQSKAAKLSYREGQTRYLSGLDSYLSVLTSLNSLQQTELNVLQAKRDVLDARIQYHNAIGGHWTREIARDSTR